MSKKCCGNCKLYLRGKPKRNSEPTKGDCNAPLNAMAIYAAADCELQKLARCVQFSLNVRRTKMLPSDGTDCPCHAFADPQALDAQPRPNEKETPQ